MQLPKTTSILLSVPKERVLLVTINRPHVLNALDPAAHFELDKVFNWVEAEDDIWVVVLTGAGDKAFCTGMDLKNANERNQDESKRKEGFRNTPPSGFAGISRRNNARKPIIAAVNGYALAGGMETILACDIVVCTEKSKFGLTEVKRGLYAAMGGISRLTRQVGYHRAAEILLTGRHLTAQEAKEFGFVNEIIPNGSDIVKRGLEWADMILEGSPDAVQLTKQGMLMALELPSLTEATTQLLECPESNKWAQGHNMKEGVAAFVEKRKPTWVSPSKPTSKL